MARCYDYYCEAEDKVFEKFYWGDTVFSKEIDCPTCGGRAEWHPSCQFNTDDWWTGKQTDIGYFDSKQKYTSAMERSGRIRNEPGLDAEAKSNKQHKEKKNSEAIRSKIGALAQEGLYDPIAYGSKK